MMRAAGGLLMGSFAAMELLRRGDTAKRVRPTATDRGTSTLVTSGDQSVVRHGPYRLVRHPGYLGSMLAWTGAAASSGNLLSLLAVLALLAIAYAHRIRTEERMLIDALGEPYAEYRRRSWRLLPFVF